MASRQGSALGISLLYLAYGDALGIPRKSLVSNGHISLGNFGEAKVDIEAEPRQALALLVQLLGNHHMEAGDTAMALQEFKIAESLLPGQNRN